MFLLYCIPSAEIFDSSQLHTQVKSICMFFQDGLIDRSVIILSDQLLRFIGIQIFQISFCGICVIVFFYIFIYKLDKLKRSQVAKSLKEIRIGLGLPKEGKILPFSAETKQGRDEIWALIDELTGLAEPAATED